MPRRTVPRVFVFIEAGQRRLVAPREAHRTIRKHALRIAHMPHYFFCTPLARCVAEVTFCFIAARQQQQHLPPLRIIRAKFKLEGLQAVHEPMIQLVHEQ